MENPLPCPRCHNEIIGIMRLPPKLHLHATIGAAYCLSCGHMGDEIIITDMETEELGEKTFDLACARATEAWNRNRIN